MFVTLNRDGKNVVVPRPGMTQSHFCSILATNYGPDCFQNNWTEWAETPAPGHVTSRVCLASSLSRKEALSSVLSGGNKCCLEFHGVFQPTFIVPQGVSWGQMEPRMALASHLSTRPCTRIQYYYPHSIYLIIKLNNLPDFHVSSV